MQPSFTLFISFSDLEVVMKITPGAMPTASEAIAVFPGTWEQYKHLAEELGDRYHFKNFTLQYLQPLKLSQCLKGVYDFNYKKNPL
jgi:hypothetical protein